VYTIKPKENIRILLISKDEYLTRALSQELSQWETNISSTNDLKNIYQKVKRESPNIILLDGNLEIDEVEMSSFLRIKRLKNTPAIIMCIGNQIAHSFENLFEKVRKRGNVYFISKPVLAKSLVSLIGDIVIRKKDTLPLELLAYEHRKSIRVKVDFALSCQFLNEAQKPPVFCQIGARAKNISAGGIMLEIQKPISLSREIELEFSLFPQQPTIMVNGEIKWKYTGNLPHHQYIGLKFKDLSRRAQNLIAQHVYTSIVSKLY
jgi:DNA-binding response OmpR family regulator